MAISSEEQAAQFADLIARIASNQGSSKTESSRSDIETLYALIAGPTPVVTDGLTITGTGTIDDPLVASASGISYSEVIWVDGINGSNSNDGSFTAPYQSVGMAAYAASLLTKTSTAVALIYVRNKANFTKQDKNKNTVKIAIDNHHEEEKPYGDLFNFIK